MTPAWCVAAALIFGELVLAVAGAGSLALAGAALLAPGLALSGLLPAPVRRHVLARWAMTPAVGLAATSVALVSLSRVGVPLTEVSVRVVLVALLAIGLLVPTGADDGEGDRADGEAIDRRAVVLEGVVLFGLLALAGVLAWRVIGVLPVPGNDWAKYVLYADEISRHHKLLIDNPFWLGGVPFREDPGMPALMGPALIMSGAAAGGLAQSIVVLGLALVLAVYGYARSFLGAVGALASTAFVVVMPASQNILGWHGLANLGALVILALVLAQAGAWLRGDLRDRPAEIGFGLALVGVAAAHRLTTAIMIGVLGIVLIARLVRPVDATRKEVVLSVARILAAAIALGLLVAWDLQTRSASSGGTLPYTSYLGTKLDPALMARDITWPLMIIAALSLIGFAVRRTLERALWPALALAVVVSLLAYVWILHLPLYYARMVFYLPLALAPLAGAGVAAAFAWVFTRAGRSPAPRWRPAAIPASALVAGLLVGVLAASAWSQGQAVRRYYLFANPSSLRGLDGLTLALTPGEPVTTDRCWSFLSAWLLRTKTYPALSDQDIGPKAELPIARQGRAMMRGTKEGRRLAKRYGVRFALLDPTCPVTAETVEPPGEVVFVSQRLAIVELER
ncbi:MAG: hypothetical protein Q7T55_13085 [Solirubrobacteraceae bacterium]|nr:hypothetical protein [Solirubrobacteraceae bacterium]